VVIVPVLLVTILLTALGGENHGAVFGRSEPGEDGEAAVAGGRFTREPTRDRVRGAP
jgi:hypothetical protein